MNNSAQNNHPLFFCFSQGMRMVVCMLQRVKNHNLPNFNQAYIFIVGHMLPCSCSFLSTHIQCTE